MSARNWVNALDEAGLAPIAPAVAGEFFPGTSAAELARKDDLCQGSEPFAHYHFFAADSRFGSLDENENQVDDGFYEIIDTRTFRIGGAEGVVFHYGIDGDTLTLSPRDHPSDEKGRFGKASSVHPRRVGGRGVLPR